uniref:Uncharacterized protein n=1 Tax=Panagrolaimus superbus TaxID=310955 RepID=A0A914YE59_9BILA
MPKMNLLFEAFIDHQNSSIPSSVAPINNQNEHVVAKPEQISQNETTQPTEEDLRSLVYPPGFKPEDLVFENHRKTTESEDDEGSIGIPVEVLDDKEADFLGDIGAFRIPSVQLSANQACVASAEAFESPVIRDNTFDHFFITFYETDSSKLDVDAMKKVTEEILKNYVVSEDRYQILFKILFKIKDLQSKAILDQSLEFLQKLFANLDFDKFLLQFWSCDKFKARDLGPIGFSFTEGQHRYDFNGILTKDDSDAVKVKAKAVDVSCLYIYIF